MLKFTDWLHLGTEKDVRAALSKFEECEMHKYVKYITGHLNTFYGKEDNEGLQQPD